MKKKIGKHYFLHDFEGVFILAKCHIKLNHTIYISFLGGGSWGGGALLIEVKPKWEECPHFHQI